MGLHKKQYSSWDTNTEAHWFHYSQPSSYKATVIVSIKQGIVVLSRVNPTVKNLLCTVEEKYRKIFMGFLLKKPPQGLVFCCL